VSLGLFFPLTSFSKKYIMKNHYTITAFVLIAIFSFKKMDMAKITPDLYMDKYEVTNGDWKTFEKYLVSEGENSAEYRSNEVWDDKYMKPFREQYYKHIAYSDYPVVGVTHEGAEKYCAWKGTKSKTKGTFRLPKIDELQYQIKAGEQGRRWKKWEKRAQKMKTCMYNFRDHDGHITAPVSAYPDNLFGVHNIKGNLAEMTIAKGEAVGGSYADLDDKDWTTHIQTYNVPTNWLGFRCVCEL